MQGAVDNIGSIIWWVLLSDLPQLCLEWYAVPYVGCGSGGDVLGWLPGYAVVICMYISLCHSYMLCVFLYAVCVLICCVHSYMLCAFMHTHATSKSHPHHTHITPTSPPHPHHPPPPPPTGLYEVLLTGGIPPGIDQPCSAHAAYRALYKRVLAQNDKYYQRFPGDVKLVQHIVKVLAAHPEGGPVTPSGNRLSVRYVCVGGG